MKEKKITLRPCPFCGLSDAWIKRAEISTGRICWKVICACGASVAWYTQRKAAVHAWNGGMRSKTEAEAKGAK